MKHNWCGGEHKAGRRPHPSGLTPSKVLASHLFSGGNDRLEQQKLGVLGITINKYRTVVYANGACGSQVVCTTGTLEPQDEGYFYYHTRMFSSSGKLIEHVAFECSKCKNKIACITDVNAERIYEEIEQA